MTRPKAFDGGSKWLEGTVVGDSDRRSYRFERLTFVKLRRAAPIPGLLPKLVLLHQTLPTGGAGYETRLTPHDEA